MADQALKPGVVVTGGGGDMGRLTAESFAADGFTVYSGDVKPVAPGRNIVPVKLDVTDRESVFALARRAAQETDLRTWINCAGIVTTAAVENASYDAWQRIIDVNLNGTFNGCGAAFDVMREPPGGRKPGGRIVNAGSISGQLGGVGPHPAYGASKAGVHALTKSYAIAGGRYGIYCNAIAPSVIEGAMGAEFGPKQREKLIAMIPLRRLANMDEIVRSIRYLADPRTSYTTGTILQLNGGALSIG